MPKRLKVLISAYACEPHKGSESYVGWNLPLELAKYHDVWVLTRANNRQPIEGELFRSRIPEPHFVYLDLPRWAAFWKRGRRRVHLYYYLWQVAAYFVARRLHEEVDFDVIHHLTFGIDWLPSFLALLPVPFVWGPTVGAQSASKPFRRAFGFRAQVQECVRTCIRRFSHLDPLMRWTARNVDLGIASGKEARQQLLRVGCKKVIMHPSVALDTAELRALSSLRGRNGASELRFVCVGNLFAFKGFSLALQAFAELRRDFPEAQLWVFGNGPERRQLDTQVRSLRVKDAVKFCESVPRSELLRKLASCDALVHPCLRGAISMACLEAMAVGLPVICLNLGGPAQQVDDNSGIKVSATSPDQVVRDLASAMRRIAASPELRRRLGLAAQARARNEFSWEARVKHINEAYYSVIGESDDSNLVNNAVTDQGTHGA